jgi:2-polyprenyl-3-methyl-5-hydroxy-6-metoxy-1,4-benzoquinol methylase
MRLDVVGENLLERLFSRSNIGPWPIVHTQIAYTLARVVMAGTRLGIFEALGDTPLSAAQVAAACGTDPVATDKLLFALAASGYARQRDGGYVLTPRSRRGLRRDSARSVADMVALQYEGWDLLGRAEEYVRHGTPIDLHETFSPERWGVYQRGMRAMASALGPELVLRLPVPKGAREMLDIGGSHGHYSVLVCRRHRRLRSTVLDLPQAVEHAAPLLAAAGMGDRVVHREGDALVDDLGSSSYDLVLIAQVVHHFTAEQNRDLVRRVATALRPGGILAIVEEFRQTNARRAGQIGGLLEFYFALTSRSGTWTVEEIAGWQQAAGLTPRRPIRFLTAPGIGIQAAVKG